MTVLKGTRKWDGSWIQVSLHCRMGVASAWAVFHMSARALLLQPMFARTVYIVLELILELYQVFSTRHAHDRLLHLPLLLLALP